jgi:hypothetical protein
LLALSLPVWAQAATVTVYSEFARIGADGKVVAPPAPREILSPAVARNAFTSFQIVVQADPKTATRLYVAQNPENAVRITLYREAADANGALTPVVQPFDSQGNQVYWVDLFTARDAPIRRIKIEPELYLVAKDDWVVYPMEVRVMAATVPGGPTKQALAAPEGFWMRSFLCGGKDRGGKVRGDFATTAISSTATSIAAMRFRNEQQDVALAATAPKAELVKRLGGCASTPPADNPEWYLPIRDYLFQHK